MGVSHATDSDYTYANHLYPPQKGRAYEALLQEIGVFISHLTIEIAMTIPKAKRIHLMCGDALSPR